MDSIKKNYEMGGTVDLGDVGKALREKIDKSFGVLAKTLNLEQLGPNFMKAVTSGSAAGFATFSKTILTTLDEAAKKGAPAIIAVMGLVKDTIMMGVIRVNQLWQGMWGGVEASMKTLTKFAIEVTVGKKSLVGQAVGGFMDNVISALMFRYEEGLAYRQTRQEMEAQTGAGSTKASAGATETMGLKWALGRDVAKQWGVELAKVGVVAEEGVLKNTVKIGLSMGLSNSETSKLLDTFMGFSSNTKHATEQIETMYRKLQVAGQAANISVKQMGTWISEAAKGARFLNVDVGTLGNTMGFLANKANEFSKFGVSIRDKGGSILKELSGAGGKGITDELHMYFGSNRGKEDIGMKAWVKSAFGEQAAKGLRETGGGGFDIAGSQESILKGGGDMMVNRLKMMKEAMLDASKQGRTADDKMFIQKKMAMDTFGLSDDAARILTVSNKDALEEIAKNPELAKEFKTAEQLLGDLRTMGSKNEAIQRALAGMALDSLSLGLQSNILLDALVLEATGDTGAAKNKLADYTQMAGATGRSIGAQMGIVMNEMKGIMSKSELNTMQGIIDTITGFVGPRKQRDSGGPGVAGESYLIGKKEIFTPNSSGTFTPLDKLGGKGGGTGGGVNMQVSISGQTKEQMLASLQSVIMDNFG